MSEIPSKPWLLIGFAAFFTAAMVGQKIGYERGLYAARVEAACAKVGLGVDGLNGSVPTCRWNPPHEARAGAAP